MSDFEKDLPVHTETLRRDPQTVSTPDELTINWKSTLQLALCKSHQLQATERAWAHLASSMRDLCPETTWLTIAESYEVDEPENIKSFQDWLEALIATPEWPFPEQVIITSTGGKNPSWKILFDKKVTKIPFTTPPMGLSVVPWRDKHNAGWKIAVVDNFNVSKAGEA